MFFAYRRYLWQNRKRMWAWTVRRRSFSEGLVSGSRFWLLIGAIVHGRRLLRKVLDRKPEPVAIARLPAGHTLSIRTIDPRSEPGG
jgi:hypothetical protein